MSLIVIDLEIPKKTRSRSPHVQGFFVDKPVVDRVSVYFPDGPLGAVGIRILDRDAQFAPAPPTYGWIVDNDHIVEWDEDHKLDGPPFQLKFEGYNMSVDHAHKIQIRMEVVSRSISDLLADLNENIEKLVKKIK